MIIQATSTDLEETIEPIQIGDNMLQLLIEGRKPRYFRCSSKDQIRADYDPTAKSSGVRTPEEKLRQKQMKPPQI